MKSSVWITGASGFIGKATLREAVHRGWVVGAIGHGKIPNVEARHLGIAGAVDGSVTMSNLTQLMQITGRPDCIIHLAGGASVGKSITQPHEDFYRTIESTAALLEWIRLESKESGLVFVSSAAVYGSGSSTAVCEAANCNPYSPYGSHKLMAEQLVEARARDFGIRAAIIRPFSVYGPGLTKQLIYDLCVRLSGGENRLTLDGTGEELRDWTHIDDVAAMLCAFTNHVSACAERWNLGTGKSTSVRSIVEQISALWPQAVELSFTGKTREGDPKVLLANTSKSDALGIKANIALSSGLPLAVAWYRKYFEALRGSL